MKQNILTTDQITVAFTERLGSRIRTIAVREWAEGVKKTITRSIWIQMDREALHDAVSVLVDIDFPHISVISGIDVGDAVALQYHFTIYFGLGGQEITVTLEVLLPKSDLSIPTISDIIPGAAYGEREKQEMLGVTIVGIPDPRRLFLPADFPEGVYPWRKDETGVRPEMVKELWASGRPTDRPAPPVPPKEEKKPKEEPQESPAGPAPAGSGDAGQARPAETGDDDRKPVQETVPSAQTGDDDRKPVQETAPASAPEDEAKRPPEVPVEEEVVPDE
jgi:membrane-bound hydrogenase subunit beta